MKQTAGEGILFCAGSLYLRAEGSSGGGKEQDTLIDFEEEIERFKPSLDVEAVEDAIVKSDLTDMTDIMMELIKERDGSKR